VILNPLPGPFGSSFDTRAGPLVLAGVYGGPVGALAAAAIGGAARLYVGGAHVYGGVLSTVLYVVTGLAFSLLAGRETSGLLRYRHVLLLSAASVLFVLPAFFVDGSFAQGLAILKSFGHILVLQNLFGIGLLGLIFSETQNILYQRDRYRIDLSLQTKLKEEVQLRGTALDAAPCGVIVTEANGDFPAIYVNDGFCRLTGFDRADIIGRNCRFLNEGLDDQAELEDLRAALGRKERCTVTVRNRRRDGGEFWNRLNIAPIRDRDGNVTHFVGVQEDVSEIKRLENRLKAAFESLTIGCVGIDLKGTVDMFNSAAEEIFGYDRAEVIGRNVSMLMPEEDRVHHDGFIANYVATGERKIIGVGRNVTGLRKNGETFPMHLGIAEMGRGDRRTFIGSVTDLTEMKLLERQLFQAQRMEAVGQLTGGVAHDFNNVMAIVLANAEFLEDAFGDNPELEDLVSPIIAAVERGSALTARLLAFSRQQVLSPVDSDVDELVEGMRDILARTLGEAVEFRYSATEGMWPARVDPAQFETALLNLAINARDAMPDGGVLSIATRNVTYDDYTLEMMPGLASGDYVAVSVSDTGTGMPPQVLERAFEPFFTTKEVGKGSGLGLSMVYGFAKQSGGYATIDSAPGQGTTVTLYLPGVPGHSLPAETAEEAVTIEPGTERILIVEDEELVRGVTARQLRASGYTVAEACDGPSALGIFRDGQRFDLLLSDIVLPGGMTGVAVAEAARNLQPGLRVLFTTGYAALPIVEQGGLNDEILLKKPYRKAILLSKVREVLDEAPFVDVNEPQRQSA
jgi:PAS domain S-box-containing protein